MKRIILHIDCNNAFLSWESAHRFLKGSRTDLRLLPAVVGGDRKKRRGIVLASSYPAKKHGIKTGMSLMEACNLFPDLIIIPPDYNLYIQCSDALLKLLLEYSPLVERYSIDECFLDATGCFSGCPIDFANMIRTKVSSELGFTVNVGVSDSKLLAKTASNFEKPDKTHSLFLKDIKQKYFPLPIYELFMIGPKTYKKLYSLGYKTIGDIACEDPNLLKKHFNLFGLLIWANANGIDHSPVRPFEEIPKGIGNGMTLPADALSPTEALPFLLSLCEISSQRLRCAGFRARVICVGMRTNEFIFTSHQKTLFSPTQSTKRIYSEASGLFHKLWQNVPIRSISIRLSQLSSDDALQMDMLGNEELRQQKIDRVIDCVRKKYGDSCLLRATSLHSAYQPVTVTTHKDYPKIKPNILK